MRSSIIALAIVCACGPGARQGDDSFGNDAGDTGSGSGSDTGSNGGGASVNVYAHTATVLYRVDPDSLAITKIGDFVWSNGADEMTDIAIDKTGDMLGVSFSSVYRIDPTNAHATRLTSALTGGFNGLSFVPAEMLGQTGDDILVGTRNSDGKVFRIDPNTGATTQVGDMGGGFASSGDLVAVEGFGTVQTVPGNGGDTLAKLAPNSFAASAVGNTGYSEIWGVAFWKNKIYGFTNDGAFILIDANTGAGTVVQENGPAWYGAAVTTAAPVIQ